MTVLMTVLAIAAPTGHVNRWEVVRPWNRKLERMHRCEDPRGWNVDGSPPYMGGLQFDQSTWESVGGRGRPHWASELEQKFRAVLLIRRRGLAPWPVCGSA